MQTLKWISSFLEECTQHVVCGCYASDPEIQQLKDTVRTLTDELALMKQSQPQQLSNEPAAATPLESSGDSENPNITRPIVMKSNNTDDKSKPNNLHLEKKFNIVVYGIEENHPDTNRELRQKQDLDKLATLLSEIDTSIERHAIKDSFRLGKFNPGNK